MTQELIANTLGVRREGVTEAAGRLQLAEAARPVTSILRIEDNLVQHCCAARKRRPPRAVVNRCLDYRHPCTTRLPLVH